MNKVVKAISHGAGAASPEQQTSTSSKAISVGATWENLIGRVANEMVNESPSAPNSKVNYRSFRTR